jgi:acyl-CoA thioester hydrolase
MLAARGEPHGSPPIRPLALLGSLARLPTEHVHIERVRFGDLDAMRHLNNVVFLRYFESARIAFIGELLPDHKPTVPEEDPTGMIFAECHINYRSPVHYDEELRVITTIGEIRRSSFQMTFQMRVGDRLAADGYGWLVGFDYVTQKPAPLPDNLREVLVAAAA